MELVVRVTDYYLAESLLAFGDQKLSVQSFSCDHFALKSSDEIFEPGFWQARVVRLRSNPQIRELFNNLNKRVQFLRSKMFIIESGRE